MDLEMQASEDLATRLTEAISQLEAATARFSTVELQATREHDLATRLAEAEATITQLQAQATGQARKTAAPGTLIAREGVSLEASSIDAALTCLSLEQRIAVKAQLLRSGLLG